jgi:hypothetical protein
VLFVQSIPVGAIFWGYCHFQALKTQFEDTLMSNRNETGFLPTTRVFAVVLLMVGVASLFRGLRFDRETTGMKSPPKVIRLNEILANHPYFFVIDLEEVFGKHQFGEPIGSCGCAQLELIASKRSHDRKTLLSGVVSPRQTLGEFRLSIIIPNLKSVDKSPFSLMIVANVVEPIGLSSELMMGRNANSIELSVRKRIRSLPISLTSEVSEYLDRNSVLEIGQVEDSISASLIIQRARDVLDCRSFAKALGLRPI